MQPRKAKKEKCGRLVLCTLSKALKKTQSTGKPHYEGRYLPICSCNSRNAMWGTCQNLLKSSQILPK
ncbi:unnamed protein product [Prunus armeniaca]|uniref:Uncharacterized protein n=1 Tax=Prunus armeniaca TaxID=36596 RepID=A0A6J5W697_PRUAR|nr:unnamed protein product [Prunus armeniaca]CAB4297120.1 unnamed protein product [Prunus armeniaca]